MMVPRRRKRKRGEVKSETRSLGCVFVLVFVPPGEGVLVPAVGFGFGGVVTSIVKIVESSIVRAKRRLGIEGILTLDLIGGDFACRGDGELNKLSFYTGVSNEILLDLEKGGVYSLNQLLLHGSSMVLLVD
jgi:hypothetical protein